MCRLCIHIVIGPLVAVYSHTVLMSSISFGRRADTLGASSKARSPARPPDPSAYRVQDCNQPQDRQGASPRRAAVTARPSRRGDRIAVLRAKRTLPWARPHLAFGPSGPPALYPRLQFASQCHTVTLLFCLTVTVSSQQCGKQWKIQRPKCTPQWQ